MDERAPDAALGSIAGLTVSYGPVRALTELDLSLRPGTWGLLGPNGAGKTTLLRVLLGLLRPRTGRVTILGHDPRTTAGQFGIRRRVGYMPEGDCLVPGTNAIELVSGLARITGLARADAITRAHEVLYYVGLEESRYRDVAGYSTGMKQRMKLAQALVHDPELLLLDEPTNGLDPKGRDAMLELIHELGHHHGKSVLLCSHLLPDVERTCDEVVVLHRGRVAGAGNVAEMTRGHPRLLRVVARAEPARLAETLGQNGLRATLEDDARTLRVEMNDADASADEIFACAQTAGVTVTSVATVRASLEEWFLGCLDGSESAHG